LQHLQLERLPDTLYIDPCSICEKTHEVPFVL
jgi:hypothetical protein